MKKLLLFILVVFAFFDNYAQNTISYNKVKYYFGDSLNSSGVIKSIEKIDSNYYLGVDAFSDSLLYTSYVVKTDEYGNKIAQSPRFGSDSTAYFIGTGNGMIVDCDSNIIVAGGFLKTEWGGFVAKLNKELDTIWTKHYLFPDSLLAYNCDTPRHRFEALTQTSDGNYIIVGSYFSDSIYSSKHTYLVKLNKNGNLMWRKIYPNLGPCFDIAVTSDSGFVFTTARIGYWGSFICKTNNLGDIQWFTTQINTRYLSSYDLTVFGNSVISVVPFEYSGNTDPNLFQFGLNVTKTNSITGQIIWTKQYIPMITVKCPTLHQHIEVEVEANENIIIVATGSAANYDTSAVAYKGFIMKLNSNGDSLWSHFYDWGDFFQRYAQFNDFVLTDDGGILAGGYWNPPYLNYKQGAWLVKMDSMGNAPGAYTVGIDENILVIKNERPFLYPNPASDNFNLRFDENPNRDIQLSIFSSSGALVKQQQLAAFGNEYRVDIQDLKAGVYFIKLESTEGLVFSSKFVKE